jgi:hypothetical protein
MLPQRLQRAEFERSVYVYQVPIGHTLENILDPDYWVHCTHLGQFEKPLLDQIEAIALDRSFYVVLLVEAVDPAKFWMKPRIIHTYWKDEPSVHPTGEAEAYEVKFNEAHKWRVIHKPTGSIVSKMHETEAEAIKARDADIARKRR